MMKMPSGWKGTILIALVLVAIWMLIVGAAMINAEYIYGDWTCAFAHCVKVKR